MSLASTIVSMTAAAGQALGLPVKAASSGRIGSQQAEHADREEAALVDAIRQGAPGSREALYHRYKRRVFALASRIAGPGDAEEVTQEAFLRIFRGLPRFRGDAALGTWIYRLAVNAALSHRSRRPPVGAPLDDLPADWEPQATTRHESDDVVLRGRLERALAKLPAGYRTVVVLHDVEGLEHEEIALILSCHVGTSKSQLHKARARLRLFLAADGIGVPASSASSSPSSPGPQEGEEMA